jgi:1,4-dihydroxy-2-naphthoate octaprenyltransferase
MRVSATAFMLIFAAILLSSTLAELNEDRDAQKNTRPGILRNLVQKGKKNQYICLFLANAGKVITPFNAGMYK